VLSAEMSRALNRHKYAILRAWCATRSSRGSAGRATAAAAPAHRDVNLPPDVGVYLAHVAG